MNLWSERQCAANSIQDRISQIVEVGNVNKLATEAASKNMPINSDKPLLWKADTQASIDQFNQWFIHFAPKTYRETRKEAILDVERCLALTQNLMTITPEAIAASPGILATLRMSTCPPLARDRLTGLSGVTKGLVGSLEAGKLPPQLPPELLRDNLHRLSTVITAMLDTDISPWLNERRNPGDEERYRSSTIIADRRCGAVAEPIVRNAQERRQLSLIGQYLNVREYRQRAHPSAIPIVQMEPGTFSFRQIIRVNSSKVGGSIVNVPVDVVIQPMSAKPPNLPLLIEAKSAGDFTNTNKRRKEEATKINQLKATFGKNVVFVLFLCGYFDAAYLGYEAAEGIDWIWEHRIQDLDQLGI